MPRSLTATPTLAPTVIVVPVYLTRRADQIDDLLSERHARHWLLAVGLKNREFIAA